MVDYSICMLCYNDVERLRESLDSILELSDLASIEVIVVDNLSNDGSREILTDYNQRGLIKCIERKCSRGRGRQIALEGSRGKYILAHLDCDDVFSALGIRDLLTLYHRDYEGMMLVTKRTNVDERSNITIGPSDLFRSLGWRGINWFEDWDLWNRAKALGKYRFLDYPDSLPPHKFTNIRISRRRGLLSRNVMTFGRYRDMYRIGRPVFPKGEAPIGQRLLFNLARVDVFLSRSKLKPVPDPSFDSNRA
ncbi:MAG: glycosyltransferase [Nitrososphaerales archaeon]|jgi:glycosyltransferase involved in cell wall biosynthesis